MIIVVLINPSVYSLTIIFAYKMSTKSFIYSAVTVKFAAVMVLLHNTRLLRRY